jgi:hypothetical protein
VLVLVPVPVLVLVLVLVPVPVSVPPLVPELLVFSLNVFLYIATFF